MFKKSRIKIIVAVMASITAILFGTLAVIYGTSYAQMTADNLRMLRQYAHEYYIDDTEKTDIPVADSNPAKTPEKPPVGDNPPPEDNHKFDVSTFYSVAIGNDGTIEKVDNESGTLYSDEKLTEYANEIIKKDSESGKIKNLAYLKTEKSGYTLVAFIDNAVMQGSMATLFRNTLIFGGISVIAVFAVSIFLSKRIVSPLEESFKKQKQFISDAGHELKTPISVISANAELLSRDLRDNQWLENIEYENERMESLVKQLLILAKTENLSPVTEEIDFSRLVSGELLPFESVAYEQGVSLHADIANDIHIEGDSARLKQLVSILTDNALKHSENGKDICVCLKNEHGKAKLSVINDGREIPQKERERIFERFYRVDKARSDDKHFGLGLAIAKAIVDSHSGKITVHCENGKIIFTVILPSQK